MEPDLCVVTSLRIYGDEAGTAPGAAPLRNLGQRARVRRRIRQRLQPAEGELRGALEHANKGRPDKT